MADDIKPQHDFDEQRRIRYELTQKGRDAIKPIVMPDPRLPEGWDKRVGR